MKKIILAITAIAIGIMGCASVQNDASMIAWKIVARRAGSALVISSPELAEATRAPAEAVLTAEDTRAAMVAFGDTLFGISGGIDDPLLSSDIIDLSSIFISDEYSWGDNYIDTAKIIIAEYIVGLGVK